jgi:hypothetical protein
MKNEAIMSKAFLTALGIIWPVVKILLQIMICVAKISACFLAAQMHSL